MAVLLRQKSKLLVAYGSCAQLGGIPGLANFSELQELQERVYKTTETTVNPKGVLPKPRFDVPAGVLDLPMMYKSVKTLSDVVCVDYYLPGCPPQTERLVEVFMALVNETELPAKQTVIGALDKTQCDECSRKKTDNKRIKKFYRPWEVEDDGETCFLEQGVICMGPATRGGCGYRCIEGGAPCRGCYGPTADAPDPGAKMMSAIATMVDSNDPLEIEEIINDVVDPGGTFYRFSLPSSIIRKKVERPGPQWIKQPAEAV
jgi:F420-non-reducing hydrogenase small subunit